MKIGDNHVVLPLDVFSELSEAAQESPSFGDRIGASVQSTVVFAGLAAAAVGGYAGLLKVADYFEQKSEARKAKKSSAQDALVQ